MENRNCHNFRKYPYNYRMALRIFNEPMAFILRQKPNQQHCCIKDEPAALRCVSSSCLSHSTIRCVSKSKSISLHFAFAARLERAAAAGDGSASPPAASSSSSSSPRRIAFGSTLWNTILWKVLACRRSARLTIVKSRAIS